MNQNQDKPQINLQYLDKEKVGKIWIINLDEIFIIISLKFMLTMMMLGGDVSSTNLQLKQPCRATYIRRNYFTSVSVNTNIFGET